MADFTTFDANGSLVHRQIKTFVGDPGQAYVIFEKEVGFAMSSVIAQQTGLSLASDVEKIPLVFYHQ